MEIKQCPECFGTGYIDDPPDAEGFVDGCSRCYACGGQGILVEENDSE